MVALEPFQDAVKAIALIRQLVHDLVSDGRAIWTINEQRREKMAAGWLGTLSFSNDDTRRHLEQIAAGNARPADFAALAEKLEETGEKVEAAMKRLEKGREHLREKYGLGFVNDLSELIYGARGKHSIRIDLQSACIRTLRAVLRGSARCAENSAYGQSYEQCARAA